MSTTPMRASFGARLTAGLAVHGRLCVGLDPHPSILADWGLGTDAAGLKEFGQRVIDAAAGRVAVVKPQVGLYEAYGLAGMTALAETIRAAKAAELLVLADAKRGDIGSTMTGYAEAWLNPRGDFGADALTVSPFLGFGALQPAVDAAATYGAGLFVLALTSNPEGAAVQLARGEHGTVAAQIAAEAAAASRALSAGTQETEALGSVGLVVGATTAHLAAEHGIDLTAGRMPVLAPGYGHQGASAAAMKRAFGAAWPHVLVTSSRAILTSGPTVGGLSRAIDAACEDLS